VRALASPPPFDYSPAFLSRHPGAIGQPGTRSRPGLLSSRAGRWPGGGL